MVKEISIEIPKLSDIPMDSLIKYLKEYDEKDRDKSIEAALVHLCRIPKEKHSALKYTDVARIYEAIQDSLSVEVPLINSFKLGGTTYAMIPNIKEISVGEYADLDSFITPAFMGDIKHETAFKFMACLFRPIVSGKPSGVYKIEPYVVNSETIELMKQAPSDVYISSVAFFLTLKKQLLMISLQYLKQEGIQKAVKQATKEQNINIDGVGLAQLIVLQMEIISNGMKSLKVPFMKLSPI